MWHRPSDSGPGGWVTLIEKGGAFHPIGSTQGRATAGSCVAVRIRCRDSSGISGGGQQGPPSSATRTQRMPGSRRRPLLRSYRVIGSRTAPGPDGCPSGGKHTQFRRETGGRRGAGGRDDVGGRVALSRPYWPPAGGRATPAADRRPREKAIARPATGSGAASDSTGSGGRNQAARLSRSGRGLATVRICSKPVGSSVPDPGGGLCIRRSPAPGLFLV